ncbi:MAG: EAL domain-containing protein [Nitriliruptorales bacterium]|nr:EAL domain-containing protein [Nitriliruptorales bacterium]
MAARTSARTMTRAHRQGLSWGFAAFGTAVIGAVLVLEGALSHLAVDVLALGAVGAIMIGIRRHRPDLVTPWLLLAGAVTLRGAADLLWTSSTGLNGAPIPPVWWMVLVSLGGSVLLGVAVLLLVRERPSGRDFGHLIDAAIVAVGLSLVAWVWFLAPITERVPASPLEQTTVAAAPFFSLVLLVLALRLIIDAAGRPLASWLLLAGLLSRVAGDAGSAFVALTRVSVDGHAIEAVWLASSLLLGSAALHPTMRRLSSPRSAQVPRLSRSRLRMLAAACLLAPTTLGIQALRGADLHLTTALTAWFLMIVLVLLRMAGLVHQLGATVRGLERSTSRERVLNALGTSLVAAQDRQEVCDAALSAARALLPSSPEPTLAIFDRVADGPFALMKHSGAYPLGDRLPELDAATSQRLRDGECAIISLHPPPVASSLPDPASPPAPAADHQISLHPLLFGQEREAVLAVITAEAQIPDAGDRLAALVSSSALALERVALSEEVHRRRSDERLTALVQNTADLIVVVGPEGCVRFASPSATDALGPMVESKDRIAEFAHPKDRPALQAYLNQVAAGEEAPPLECRLRGPCGWRDYETVGANLLDDPNVAGIVLTSRDITERKTLQRQLHRRAMYDPLTGLANRALFGERVAKVLEGPGTVAVLFIDLDDFKVVNDSMGHAAGDQVIAASAGRLAGGLRSGDTAARLGGDEFAVLLPQVASDDEAKRVATRILDAFRAPFVVEGRQFSVRASVGIAVARQASATAAELLRNADLAMYRAKATGKGCAACYEPELHRSLLSRLDQQAQLAAALQQGEIVPHYQPIVALSGQRIAGVEVFARWRHPQQGLLPAADFLEVAEQTGLILPLGQQVLTQACHQVAAWRDWSGVGDLFLSVNLCPSEFASPDLAGQVRRALRASELPPGALVLELPEACLLRDHREALERVAELRMLGVQVAMVGLGTGSLPLSSLASMKADLLKLDCSLLAPVRAEEGAAALAAALSQLVRGLRLPVVAQGVETVAQKASLLALGCTYAQGILLGKPSEPEVIGSFLPRMHALGL